MLSNGNLKVTKTIKNIPPKNREASLLLKTVPF
jgi:hypothetical protein